MATDSQNENQYLFRETEFEEEVFHAAAFVAKYRRVTSLDSLRDQLRTYCDSLKQQLYSIINRDYKDFITIATKLDGVDVRVEHLRKPLEGLRFDVAALHDSMNARLHTIEDKLRHRGEVVGKRRLLEATLACLEKLDVAEEIVLQQVQTQGHGQGQGQSASTRPALLGAGAGHSASATGMRRRELLKSFSRSKVFESKVSTSQFAQLSLSRDIFDCSELERAAHAIAQAKSFLSRDAGSDSRTKPTGTQAQSSSTVSGVSLQSMTKSLEQRVSRVMEQLLQRIRARLAAIFTAAVAAAKCSSVAVSSSGAPESKDGGDDGSGRDGNGDGNGNGSGNNDGEPSESVNAAEKSSGSEFPSRAFAHCLRALVILGKGAVAEEVVAETITLPMAKTLLTQGKVDGSGGRGSYEGLNDALQIIAKDVVAALAVPLRECAQVFPGSDVESSSSSSGQSEVLKRSDIIVYGVWKPVANLLMDRFPGIFSVGIANTLARCYRAIECFIDVLGSSSDSQNGDQRSSFGDGGKGDVLARHPVVKSFQDNWKLDLYLQLRTQEIIDRVDRACQLTGELGLSTKVSDALYSISGKGGNDVSAGAGAGAGADIPSQTLSVAEMEQLRAELAASLKSVGKLSLPLSKAFCTELCTCLHPSVSLRAVAAKFFALSLRILLRLEAHAAVISETPTPSFPRQVLANMIQQLQAHQLVQGQNPAATTSAAGVGSNPMLTPVKSAKLPAGTGNPPPGPTAAVAGAVSPLTALANSVAAGSATPGVSASASASASGVPPASASGKGATATGSAPQQQATATADDLILLASDLATLAEWLVAYFAPKSQRLLGLGDDNDNGCGGKDRNKDIAAGNQIASQLHTCLQQHKACFLGTRDALWSRVCVMLASDCKKGLVAVRAVAAKYRMTNKPPPDAASPYVETVLQPFRHFIDRHGALLPSVRLCEGAGSEVFAVRVLEDVSAGFLQQVQALMETVRQMDSALQRRSKARAAATATGSASAMTDSDKISLQLLLDVRAFGTAIVAMDVLRDAQSSSSDANTDTDMNAVSSSPVSESGVRRLLPSYEALVNEVSAAEKLLAS